jgi:hypothetical protein
MLHDLLGPQFLADLGLHSHHKQESSADYTHADRLESLGTVDSCLAEQKAATEIAWDL